MEINIADIIKPKFKPLEDVYVRQHNSKDHVRKMRIDSWEAKIKGNSNGKVNGPDFTYLMTNSETYREDVIFRTPEEAFDAK